MSDLQGGKVIPISEIYGPVTQGEGALAGLPTTFVRVGGCDFRCDWCDSLYAVLPKYKSEWTKMSCFEILEAVWGVAMSPIMVTLSGGNPALYDFTELINSGHEIGYTFAIETQATKYPEWAPLLDHITLSPKPPSSKMEPNWGQLSLWLDRTPENARCLKVVVFDEADFTYAGVVREYARRYEVPMFLQAGTNNPYSDTSTIEGLNQFRANILEKTDWLGKRVIASRWNDVRVLPQIHALIGGAKRGI